MIILWYFYNPTTLTYKVEPVFLCGVGRLAAGCYWHQLYVYVKYIWRKYIEIYTALKFMKLGNVAKNWTITTIVWRELKRSKDIEV